MHFVSLCFLLLNFVNCLFITNFINSSCIVLKHGMTCLGERMILHLFEASTNLFDRFGHHSLTVKLSLSLGKNIRIFYFILKLTNKL
jgi:hypothetical protein